MAHCLRRWPDIDPILGECLVFDGILLNADVNNKSAKLNNITPPPPLDVVFRYRDPQFQVGGGNYSDFYNLNQNMRQSNHLMLISRSNLLVLKLNIKTETAIDNLKQLNQAKIIKKIGDFILAS